jgi:PAS domain S-box-containing protein
MTRAAPRDLRRSLAVLVLVATLPLMALGTIGAWMLVDQRREAVATELAGTARALQVAVDRQLEIELATMDALAITAAATPADLATFGERARRVLDRQGSWRGVWLIDASSQAVLAQAGADTALAASIAPQAVDQVSRQGRATAAGIVSPDPPGQRPYILLLAPARADAAVRHVLAVALDPKALNAVFADQGLDPSWTGAIIDTRLMLAGRSRDAARFVGKPATPTLAERVRQGHKGMFSALNQEGATVYTVLSRSASSGWSVAIGVPASYVEGPARTLLAQLAGGALGLIALGLSLTVAVSVGIVRRRHADEKALDEGRALLDSALAGSHLGVWDLRLPVGTLSFSERVASILGHAPDALEPSLEQWGQLVHPDDLEAVRSAMTQHAAGAVPLYEAEYRLRHREGHWVWVLARGQVTERDAEGRPTRAMGTVLDVTERKQTEISAQRDRARLQAILTTTLDGIHIVDQEGLLVEANPAFLGMLGLDRGAIGSLKVDEWDADITLEQFGRDNADLLDTGAPRVFEARHLRRDGSVLDVEISASRMKVDGRWFLCAVSRDITLRKRTEAELLRHRDHLEELVRERTAELGKAKEAAESANRAKSTFLASMSHELRTPMNAILGLTSLMLNRAVEPKQRDQLGKTMTAARHLLSIINDILDLSKIEADSLVLRPSDFVLRDMVAEAVQLVSEAARAKGLDIRTDIAIEVPALVHGDRVRVSQILVNYLGNAVKFSERGTIRLRVVCESDDAMGLLLRFEVVDQGPGIDAELQARLFEPFVQGDNATTRAGGGTGLGLTICRRIARQMHGEAGVTSAPGQGSTFWARLRFDHAALPASAPSSALVEDPAQVLRREFTAASILLVDDNPVNREVALALLESVGLAVTATADGRECVELARTRLFDMVLMDLQMPGMDGIQATREIRQLPGWADVPIVAMTASVYEEERQACLAAGMNGYLVKPVEASVLYAKVLKWLTHQRRLGAGP